VTEIERLQQAMLDSLKAKAAAEFWEDAHDRVKDRMLELEAEVDSLRQRLHELGEEADRQYEILASLRNPSDAVAVAVMRLAWNAADGSPEGDELSTMDWDTIGAGVQKVFQAAIEAAEREVANEVR